MSKSVIEVDQIGKFYTYGTIGAKTLQESLQVWVRRILGKEPHPARIESGKSHLKELQKGPRPNTFWALKDVSFSVEEGEVVGVIGSNGAGKTTLLKILSRVTLPSCGRAWMRGRVGALLEVGAGMHPELTGRENIYLNGTILGMKRSEISHKFDEIVTFAELEEFIDTPVKRYSSGMYVRLGFSIAAHLEPEILLVDEVLAVGDLAFQKKCLLKIKDLITEGGTVLFVSHNMAAIENLCQKVMLVQNGQLVFMGSVDQTIQKYLEIEKLHRDLPRWEKTVDSIKLKLEIHSAGGSLADTVRSGEGLQFVVEVQTPSPIEDVRVGIGITDMLGQRIVTLHTHYQCSSFFRVQTGGVFKVFWPENFLCPGSYLVAVGLLEGEKALVYWPNAGLFHIAPSDYFKTGRLPNPNYQGHVLAHATWEVVTDVRE